MDVSKKRMVYLFKLLSVMAVSAFSVNASAAYPEEACKMQISQAAIENDPRVQAGTQGCVAIDVVINPHGVGFGQVGSVKVACLDKDGGSYSSVNYQFHLLPGSCEVSQIEKANAQADLNSHHFEATNFSLSQKEAQSPSTGLRKICHILRLGEECCYYTTEGILDHCERYDSDDE